MTTLESILGHVESTISTAQDLADIINTVSNPEIAARIAMAEADPTSANVRAVITAYADAGEAPPVKLVAHLLMINEERHPEDTVRGDIAPWLFAGVALIWLLSRKRR